VSRYRFIEVEKVNHATRTLCRVLQVSRAAYYHWAIQPLSARARTDLALTERIAAIHARSRQTYGAPRVHAELQVCGARHGRKRVARLMRSASLAGRVPRRYRHTTVADPLTEIPDLVQRDFTPTHPDQLWVGDITYIRTWEGWLYLATLLDCYSRRVVGWAMADHLRTELPLRALHMALARRHPAGRLRIRPRRCVLGLTEVSVKAGQAQAAGDLLRLRRLRHPSQHLAPSLPRRPG